jgi:3-deoxy-D-manno-octulosonic-acid transferase
VTASLALYSAATWALEPLAPALLRQRAAKGKERTDRIAERLGRTPAARPAGPLVWMHGASVGESRLLLDLFAELRSKRPGLNAVVTTQTLTSADMIASRKLAGVTHQMAPVDAPGPVTRFLAHWRPDAAVFAEGEIWPNMLRGLARARIPAALANARMTAKTLAGWRSRSGAARELFAAFRFIGAADRATAEGLGSALGRPIDTIGNLKRAAPIDGPDPAAVAAWRAAIGPRKVLLAASTHPGEDEIALDAFRDIRTTHPDALLVTAPRHPVRGPAIADLAKAQGLTPQLRSVEPSPPTSAIDVLVADTMGELLFWYAAADAVYLAGASVRDVGGHNPVEPAQLGKRVFTGPHGFNFADMFTELSAAGLVTIGHTAADLAQWWRRELQAAGPADTAALQAFLAESRAPFAATVEAVLALIPAQP